MPQHNRQQPPTLPNQSVVPLVKMVVKTEDDMEDNHEFDDSVQENKDDLYEPDNDSIVAPNLSTRGSGERSSGGKGKTKRFHPKVRGFTHMNETERVTLVNLIKTLDKDQLLRGDGSKERNHEAVENRKVLWVQLVSTFNEICGLNYDKGKLKAALNRIKTTPSWKSHSLLFEDC